MTPVARLQWRALLLTAACATVAHVALTLVFTVLAHVVDSSESAGHTLALVSSSSGPLVWTLLGFYWAFRGVNADFWSSWWRAQAVYWPALLLNLVLAGLLFALDGRAEASKHGGEMMLWIAPGMWPPILWPVAAVVRWIVRARKPA